MCVKAINVLEKTLGNVGEKLSQISKLMSINKKERKCIVTFHKLFNNLITFRERFSFSNRRREYNKRNALYHRPFLYAFL